VDRHGNHAPLPTWDEALDAIDEDPDAEPAHVVRFGTHVHAEGVTPGDRNLDRTIGYITKYITKSAADCHAVTTDRQAAHLERLWRELRVMPCSGRCANWLLYGIQPKNAHGKLRPGGCKGRRDRDKKLNAAIAEMLMSFLRQSGKANVEKIESEKGPRIYSSDP
jgi:hypothetical protein